jgi:hypothetical protein
MIEYRRGATGNRRNDLWHTHSDCESYPTQMFEMRTGKPADDQICPTCKRVSASFNGPG